MIENPPAEKLVVAKADENPSYDEDRVFVRAMESGSYSLRRELERQRNGPRVFKTGLRDWHAAGPQTFHKNLVNPGHGLLQTLQSSFELLAPGGRSQKHGHQNPALLYVLDGHGYDVSDGERVEWEAGDMVLVAPGTVHQHFNADPDEYARVCIIKGKPLYMFAHLIFQGFVEKAPQEATPGHEGWAPDFI